MNDPTSPTAPSAPDTPAPVPPIAISGDPASAPVAVSAPVVPVPHAVLAALRSACAEVSTDPALLAESSRDWWPLGMIWATEGRIPGRAAALVRPSSPEEVSDVLRICNDNRIPVTASGGRSGVLGASVPLFGGVQLDMCNLRGIRDIDTTSLIADVLPGTFGSTYEEELRKAGFTGGHWPQSIALSTVGGWLACRGAGQLSTRYGKIEDMVVGLDVALADGTTVHTGGFPRAAVGPDLNQLFVGSEGTLGIITGARLGIHRLPGHQRKAAYSFSDFESGLEWLRAVIQRGARPAVLRLYDPLESARHFSTAADRAVAVVLDEGEPAIVDADMAVVDSAARSLAASDEDATIVDTWLANRNEVSALEALISRGYIVDTMEVSGRWADLPTIARVTLDALGSAPGSLAAGVHCSHSYDSGACLYFTFAAEAPEDERQERHQAIWAAATNAVLTAGGSLSHHHGVGLNRSPFVRAALGDGFDVLAAVKAALDPNGILNPGKLGLASPFGSAELSA